MSLFAASRMKGLSKRTRDHGDVAGVTDVGRRALTVGSF
jgi:hypothetical protein